MSSEMNSIPSEVVFAQKASAIVKAAGMDPRSMDLESFRSHILHHNMRQPCNPHIMYNRKAATFIFCRAYIAIFKEHLLSDVDSFDDRMGKDEQMLNAQLVRSHDYIII